MGKEGQDSHKHNSYHQREQDSQEKRYRRDSKQREHKKKKKNKEHRHSRSRSDSMENRHKSKKRKHSRSRDRSRQQRHKEHRRYDQRQSHRDNRDRPQHKKFHHKEVSRDKERKKQDPVLAEKDPYFDQRKQIQKMRKHNQDKAEQMQNELEKKIIFDKKQKQYEQAKRKFNQAQKEVQQAKRQDLTILVYCLPLKAKEKHIWNFFFKAGCGKIRDIRIIKDARSGRSKGVAYVQFYTSQAVQKALTMSQRPFELKGRQFGGLKIQHSQAQKNRAAAAARQMRVSKPQQMIEMQQQSLRKQMKVLVGGLTGKLADTQQSQLKQLFEPFGAIDYVDIHRDPTTGKCKGFAFIQYSNPEDAQVAERQMNNLDVGGQTITVKVVNITAKGDYSNPGQEFLHSYGNKQSLMNQLARGSSAPTHSNLARPPISTVSTPYLLLTNLFVMQGTTPAFFEELKKEIMKTCSQYGIIEKCFVEKNNQGNVWVKFSDTASCVTAQSKLNGQFFDNKKVFCYFVTEQTYQGRVGI